MTVLYMVYILKYKNKPHSDGYMICNEICIMNIRIIKTLLFYGKYANRYIIFISTSYIEIYKEYGSYVLYSKICFMHKEFWGINCCL